MAKFKKLLVRANALEAANKEIITFLAILVNREGGTVSINIEELKTIENKTFDVKQKDDVITISLT